MKKILILLLSLSLSLQALEVEEFVNVNKQIYLLNSQDDVLYGLDLAPRKKVIRKLRDRLVKRLSNDHPEVQKALDNAKSEYKKLREEKSDGVNLKFMLATYKLNGLIIKHAKDVDGYQELYGKWHDSHNELEAAILAQHKKKSAKSARDYKKLMEQVQEMRAPEM